MKWLRFLSIAVSETLCADFAHNLPLSLELAELGSAQCDQIKRGKLLPGAESITSKCSISSNDDKSSHGLIRNELI